MKLTLAELMPIKNRIIEEIHYNQMEVHSKSEYITERRKDIEEVDLTENEELLKSKLEAYAQAQDDLRNLTEKINKTNNDTILKTEYGDVSIAKALNLAKQLRERADLYGSLSRKKDFELSTEYGSSIVFYKKAILDPLESRKEALKLKSSAQRISALIEKANNETIVEVEGLDKYM